MVLKGSFDLIGINLVVLRPFEEVEVFKRTICDVYGSLRSSDIRRKGVCLEVIPYLESKACSELGHVVL